MTAENLPIQCRADGTAVNTACSDLIARHGLHDFDLLMQRHDGEIIKHALAQRKTVRLHLPGGTRVYLKRHYPVGLFAAFKRLLKCSPEPTAYDEFENIAAFHGSDIPTVAPVSAGRRAAGFLQTESFLVTMALEDTVKLDAYLSGPLCINEKRLLVAKTAALVKKMHAAGFNHRDLYLCHILRRSDGDLFIVDLHRVQRRGRVPGRWLVKDMAALNYSARGLVSRTDRLRFFKAYRDSDRLTEGDKRFILKVLKKTRKMLQHNRASECR